MSVSAALKKFEVENAKLAELSSAAQRQAAKVEQMQATVHAALTGADLSSLLSGASVSSAQAALDTGRAVAAELTRRQAAQQAIVADAQKALDEARQVERLEQAAALEADLHKRLTALAKLAAELQSKGGWGAAGPGHRQYKLKSLSADLVGQIARLK